MAVDHLFVCVSVGGNEAARVASVGLREGAPNQHPGQGTACRRFFFHNAYLELLWVNCPEDVQSGPIRSTGLWERWAGRNRGACPFGLCFRPRGQLADNPPFSTWQYDAPYLPKGMSFRVGNNADLVTEPGLFYLTFGRRPDAYPVEKFQLMGHPPGLREITRVGLVSPNAGKISPELRSLMTTGLVAVREGPDYVIELGIDGGSQGIRTCVLIYLWFFSGDGTEAHVKHRQVFQSIRAAPGHSRAV